MNTTKYPNSEIGSYIDGLRKWSAFCTFTTEYKLTMYSTEKLASKLYQALESQLKTDINMYWVAEPHADQFRYHLHCLINADLPFEQLHLLIRAAWSKVSRFPGRQHNNRFDIQEYDESKNGAHYLTKSLNQESTAWGLFLSDTHNNFCI